MLNNDVLVLIKVDFGKGAPVFSPYREYLVDLHYSCICHHITTAKEFGAIFGIEDVRIGLVKPSKFDIRRRMQLIQNVEDAIHYISASVELPDPMITPPLFHKFCFCDVPIPAKSKPCPCFKKRERLT